MNTKQIPIDIEKSLTHPVPVVETDEEWQRAHAPLAALVLATVALAGCGVVVGVALVGAVRGWW